MVCVSGGFASFVSVLAGLFVGTLVRLCFFWFVGYNNPNYFIDRCFCLFSFFCGVS